jgi:hypothetical protein
MEGERRFSDKQVKTLLARTVELASSSEERATSSEGVSLAELERAAAEAGPPLEPLRRAVEELDLVRPADSSWWRRILGAEVQRAEHALDSAPDRAALERLLLVLPDLARVPGSGALADDRLVWRSDSASQYQSGIRRRIEVLPLPEGRGLVKVEVDPSTAAAAIYGGIVGGLGLTLGLSIGLPLGLGSLHSAAFATLVPILSVAVSAILSRGIMAAISSWVTKRVRILADEASRQLRERRGEAAPAAVASGKGSSEAAVAT